MASASLCTAARRAENRRGVTCALPMSNHARATIESLENRLFMHAGTEAGTGLLGQYFDNKDFTNAKLTRTDAQVNFTWGYGAPASGVGAETFSVRWTGQLVPHTSENYTFSTSTDDGVRLWI